MIFMENISQEPVLSITIGLALVTLVVLLLPFFVRFVEHNLEIFFLVMGVLAVTISGLWSWDLLFNTLKAPVTIGSLPLGIFQVVLVFGVLLYYINNKFCRFVLALSGRFSLRVFIFLMVLMLGLISSIISVIVTAVLLAEIVAVLPLNKTYRIRLVVITCFAVGLGAVLTPLGEPLSTILVQKLSGAPYDAGFTFPASIFSIYVIPGVIAIALLAAFWIGKKSALTQQSTEVESPSKLRDVIVRAVKVFIFVAALVLLGEGLKPLVVWYIIKIPAFGLYWINILSAVLDNATLTAVEINATMAISQIVSIIMALLISGGILIPGNIPNIVAAGRLKITMKEWALIGVPVGLVLLVIYFLVLLPVIFS
jgi:predicted cation transporter